MPADNPLPTLTLTRFQLLEACNEISKQYGGMCVGNVDKYRNQHLISVELGDLKHLSGLAHMLKMKDAPDFDEIVWIRLGFCQSQIGRAPAGGFSIRIEMDVLSRCRTVEHVLQYVAAMFNKPRDYDRAMKAWYAETEPLQVTGDVARLLRIVNEVKDEKAIPVEWSF